MAVTAHTYPKFYLGLGQKTIDLATDSLAVGLIASGTYAWNATSQAHEYVSDFLAGSGGGALTEVSTTSTGYTRQALASVTWTVTGLVASLGCANPAWADSTISAVYAFFFDNTPTTDATRPLLAYWDLGGTVSDSAGSFTLDIAAGGLISVTAS